MIKIYPSTVTFLLKKKKTLLNYQNKQMNLFKVEIKVTKNSKNIVYDLTKFRVYLC